MRRKGVGWWNQIPGSFLQDLVTTGCGAKGKGGAKDDSGLGDAVMDSSVIGKGALRGRQGWVGKAIPVTRGLGPTPAPL